MFHNVRGIAGLAGKLLAYQKHCVFCGLAGWLAGCLFHSFVRLLFSWLLDCWLIS
jgi:hypothetical protein